MVSDLHEDEQLERIKKWWKENGSALIIGVSLGIAVIFGWRAWQLYQHRQAEAASALYQQTFTQFQQNQAQEMRTSAERLLSEYGGSNYASLASLLLAKQALKDKQSDAALAHLDWVVSNSPLHELIDLAKLRKARILLDQNNAPEALKLIEQTGKSFEGLAVALQGDVYLQLGQHEEAKKAYQQALLAEDLSDQQKQWLQLKLDDLGTSTPDFTAQLSEADVALLAQVITPAPLDAPANAQTPEHAAPSVEIQPIPAGEQ